MDYNKIYNKAEDFVKDHSDQNAGTGRLVAGLLIGAGIGVLAGILLAPKAGKETIADVSNRAGDWKGQLSGLLDRVSGLASDYLDKGKEKANQTADKVSSY